MISEALRKARNYEEKKEQLISPSERPAFHLTPRTGWMNDPNGFCFYNGKYHLFYQYNPYRTDWGPMHWGHAVSTDLFHWEYLPCALAPDTHYETSGGCFSGGAIALPDGRQLLMYTGVKKEEHEDGTWCDIQTQNIAIGDGVNYEKYAGNPVLTEEDLPAGASRIDFRDPKIWRDEDGIYWCVLSSRPADGSGSTLLYRSEDALAWEFVSILAENGNRYGKMWECPDFFELNGKGVLMVSPQDMEADGEEFCSGNGNVAVIGTYDKEQHKLIEEQIRAIDYGIDFYATQSLESPDGRRIMLGWMQNWDTCGYRNDMQKWFGQVTIARELELKDGRLLQKPVRELDALHGEEVSYENVQIENEKKELAKINGRIADLFVEADVENCSEFTVNLAENEKYFTKLSYNREEGTLTFDRRRSGVKRAVDNVRTCKVNTEDGKLELRIILDRFSAEVFVGDGEKVMSMCLFTDLDAERISFSAKGQVNLNAKKYELAL